MRSRRASLVVRGGSVVSEHDITPADVLLADGRVLDLVAPGTPADAERVIDATDQLVMPGLVDPHCHFNTFSHHVDDLRSLSSAALAGGVTTIIPFLIPGGRRGQPATLAGILDHFIEEGRENSLVDFSFHVALWPRWEAVSEVDACVERGCSSFKMFLALPRLRRMVPDDMVVAFMERIRERGGVSMVHAENGLVTEYLESRMQERGDTAPSALGRSRPPILEEEATFRAICLSQVAEAPLYVVHVTCEGSATRIAEARRRGLPVVGETCPQYLTLDESAMETWGPLAKVAPPLRTPASREHLWAALSSGDLSMIGSDHSAHLRSTKEQGAKNVFDNVPFGAAMIETMLPVLVSDGLAGGRLTPERLVEVASSNPARIFGLYPQKGVVQPGSDGDLVLIDLASSHTVDASRHHDLSGYSLYDGQRLRGAVRTVIAGGEVVASDGELISPDRLGRFLPRASSEIPSGLS